MSTSTQLLPLIFALNKARTRRDQHNAVAAIMMFQFHQMPVPVFRHISISSHRNTLLEMLLLSTREGREIPSGDLDPLNSSINLRILKGKDKRFKQMFRLSRNVFNCLLHELVPFLDDGKSRNHRQNVPASLKLGVALYFFAHGWDAFYLEAASGLSKPTALKYVHQVAELICTKLAPQWMGPVLLKQDNYMESNRERFRLRNGVPYVGAAIDGTHIPYFPNAGDSQQDYKN